MEIHVLKQAVGTMAVHARQIAGFNPEKTIVGRAPGLEAAAPRRMSLGLESMVEKSVMAPIPKKIRGGKIPWVTPK